MWPDLHMDSTSPGLVDQLVEAQGLATVSAMPGIISFSSITTSLTMGTSLSSSAVSDAVQHLLLTLTQPMNCLCIHQVAHIFKGQKYH